MVPPTVLGVRDSEYGMRLPRLPVDLELGLWSRVALGGMGGRPNSKICLKIGLGPPRHALKPWGISSLLIESYMG